MMKFCKIIILLIFVSYSSGDVITEGQCELFDAVPLACQFVSSNRQVWTSNNYGLTQEYWTAYMESPIANLSSSILDILTVLPYDCANLYLSLFCPTIFRPCISSNPMNGLPYDLPVPICKSECLLVNEGCQAFFAANDVALDCDQPDPLTGQPQWPDAATLTPPATCLTFIDLNITESPVYPCPPPLVFAAPKFDPNTGLPCSTTCHYKIRQTVKEPKDDNFDDLFIVFSVLNWISFVSAIITVIALSLFRDNHDYPRNINIFLGCAIILLHMGWVGNSFRSPDSQWCESKYAIDPNSSWCLFQSWIIFFACLCIIGFWIFGAIIMFWDIALLRFNDRRLSKIAPFVDLAILCYSLIASLILVFVPNDRAGGYSPGTLYCFLGPDYDWEIYYGLYAWPWFLGVIIVVICCVSSMIRIAYMTTSQPSVSNSLKHHIRPQMTIFLFLCFWLLIVASWIAITRNVSQKQSFIDSLTAWYQCVFVTQGLSTDCPNPIMDDPDIVWWANIMFSIVGLFYAIIFLVVNPSQQSLFRNAWHNYQAGTPIFARRNASTQTTGKGSSSGLGE